MKRRIIWRSKDRRKLRERLMSEDPHCWYCGKDLVFRFSTIDHYLPFALGGSDAEENLRLACDDCNTAKGSAHPDTIVCSLTRGEPIFSVGEVAMRKSIAGFNYESLKSQTDRKAVRLHTTAIHQLLERTSVSVIDIGKRLREVRTKIGRRHFQAWIEAEFCWQQSTASNYMRVSERFSDLECVDNLQPSALFALARKAVPGAAVKEAVAEARIGRMVTKKRATEIIAKHSPKADGGTSTDHFRLLTSSISLIEQRASQWAATMPAAEARALSDQLAAIAQRLAVAASAPELGAYNSTKGAK